MTANLEPDEARPMRLAPEPGTPVATGEAPPIVRPMPRLGRGIVWSDIVAEIERDHADRMRDAA